MSLDCSVYIPKVVCGRGNNLHEVESTTGVKFLVSMPTKFRRNVWIKRGGSMHATVTCKHNILLALCTLFSVQSCIFGSIDC